MNTPVTHEVGSPEHFLSTVQPIHSKVDDIDLVGEVRVILAEALGPTNAAIGFYDTDPNITLAKGLTTEIQRWKINLFLNSQYSMLPGNINVHRSFIQTSGPIELWLEMFKTYHAPTMARLGLPAAYDRA